MAIELKEACFGYTEDTLANENLNLVIREGERVAIIGQNGAGKTTCVKMMNGLNKPSKGDVLVDGENTKDHKASYISRTVGYVFQNPDDQIFNQSVRKEIEYMPRYQKLTEKEIKERVDRAVMLTQLEKYIEKNPFDIPYPIRKFVTIADVLAIQPKYIIFDEPTAGQDRKGNEILSSLMDTLGEEGISVITITHDMEFVAKNFNRVIVMAHKNIIADGTAEEIFSNDAILAEARIRRPQLAELTKRLGLARQYFDAEELAEVL